MANKIDSHNPPQLHVGGQNASGKARGDVSRTHDSAPSAPAAGADTVNLTDSARQLAALESAVAAAGQVDSARVEAIRTQIESGAYEVSPQKIADNLLRFDQSLPAGS